LSQNYPNPFNPLTTIKYQLPEAAEIELVIYNILGQEIYTLINGKKQAGYHSQAWNATDQYGNAVASGLYIYRLDAKGVSGRKFVQVKKMVVLK
jgi:flagellar hook assembly protein FlgD